MKSMDLKKLRQRLGLDRLQFARLIGYTGTDRNDMTRVRKYENTIPPPLHIARFAWLMEGYVIEHGRLPRFPDWDGYDVEYGPDQQREKGDA